MRKGHKGCVRNSKEQSTTGNSGSLQRIIYIRKEGRLHKDEEGSAMLGNRGLHQRRNGMGKAFYGCYQTNIFNKFCIRKRNKLCFAEFL